MSQHIAWLRLQLTLGLGRVAQFRLINHFGSPSTAVEADPADWPEHRSLPKRLAQQIPPAESMSVERAFRSLEENDIWLCSYWDQDYPELLRAIPDPPVLLYGRGGWKETEALAIVGARKTTPSGRQVATDLGRELAAFGVTIVSGLARGIDTAAHQGALEADGRTVAILGCGVDRIYPPENKPLFHNIIEQGAVISEYPPGTEPLPGHFPGRNRLISGLCRGVLVIEAALGSGSLITADFALEQGREVMAVPGNITQPTSAGSNRLLKQGAHPVTEPEDILQLLWSGRRQQQAAAVIRQESVDLPAPIQRILDLLDSTPRHIDTLLQESGLTPIELSDILLHLELQGCAEQLPGTHYIRGHMASLSSPNTRESA